MKRVLVIGGGGYLGDCLVEELRCESVEPWILDIREKDPARGVKFISGDRNNYDDLVRARQHHFDFVIDLVAYRSLQTGAAIKAFSGYTGRFIHLSTFSVYQVPPVSPYTEEQPLVDYNDNSYMNQKAQCERVLVEAGEQGDFPFVIIRSAPVMGPHDRVSRENYFIKRMLIGQPIVVPDTDRLPVLLVFVKDLVRAVVRAMFIEKEKVVRKAFHVAQPELMGLNAHIRSIGELVGRSAEIICVPSGDLAAAGFNLSAFPYYTSTLSYPDTSAAAAVLALNPTPYREALKETVDWFMANDPLNQPAWPGRTSMQARMAAVNDTIHQLKEQAFIEEYKKIRRICRKQVTTFKTMYKSNQVEDMVESVTGFFTGCSFAGNQGAGTTRLLVQENQLNELMGSAVGEDLDIFNTFICLAPGLLFPAVSTSGSPENRTRGNFNLKRQFNAFAYLEPFESRSEKISRYYLYNSSLKDLPYNRLMHYTHDYSFYVLNLLEACNVEKRGEIYPHEIDICPAVGGRESLETMVADIGERALDEEIIIDLSADLNKYYFGQCRLLKSGCRSCELENIIVDGNGVIRPCFWGSALGTLDERLEVLRGRLREMAAEVEKERNCQRCPIYDGCPRCLFVEEPEFYCETLKNNPYIFRYTAIYDFLRRLIQYDKTMKQYSFMSLKVSTPRHRCLLPYLDRGFEKGEQGRYRVKEGLLPVIAEGRLFVYDILERTVIKLNPAAFLVLEALEEKIAHLVELAGSTLDYPEACLITEADIRGAELTLARNHLVSGLKFTS